MRNFARVFLVGGAVRDQLLGREVKDRDWVVVGATPENMLTNGFEKVGADFPVFLHPESGEEYALARTERKSGKGYGGFTTVFSDDVTLEEDLLRRDLTVNAMALDPETGEVIDPYGGQADLEARTLRHVSEAFAEDPLRVLRVARFKARYHALGFTVADETLDLMRRLVDAGEMAHLTPERVWAETEKAMNEDHASQYFLTLYSCGALDALFPEIANLFWVPQPEEHHPEICTGVHTMLVLDRACELSSDPVMRFAALCHDLGKGTTPVDKLPHHQEHELRGAELVKSLCKRFKIPNQFRELAHIVAKYHTVAHGVLTCPHKTVLKLLERTDAFRRPERFEKFLLACEADAQGRAGFALREYCQTDILRAALAEANGVQTKTLLQQGFTGEALGQALHKERLAAVKRARHTMSYSSLRYKYLEAAENWKYYGQRGLE